MRPRHHSGPATGNPMKDNQGGHLEYGVRDIQLPGWRPNHVKRCRSLIEAKAWANEYGGNIVVRGVSRWRYLEDQEASRARESEDVRSDNLSVHQQDEVEGSLEKRDVDTL